MCVGYSRSTSDFYLISYMYIHLVTAIYLPDTELAKLDGAIETHAANTNEFMTTSEVELKAPHRKAFDIDLAQAYEKWAEHKRLQTDLVGVVKESLVRVLQQFYAELVKDIKEYMYERCSLKVVIHVVGT